MQLTKRVWTPREIKELRDALRMTQGQFAREVGVFYTSIANWEHGRLKPSARNKKRLDDLERRI